MLRGGRSFKSKPYITCGTLGCFGGPDPDQRKQAEIDLPRGPILARAKTSLSRPRRWGAGRNSVLQYLRGRREIAAGMWPAKILVGCDDAGIRGRLSHHKIVSGQSEVSLLVNIEHQFREAHASIWLDHQLVYERTLQGTAKSHVGLFRKRSEEHTSELQSPDHLV